MKYLAAIAVMILCSSATAIKECKSLGNGSYYVQYDQQFKPAYHDHALNISGDNVVIDQDGQSLSLRLKWIGEDRFTLTAENQDKDSSNEVLKTLKTLGDPYYEITACSTDTVFFTLRVNPHIIINSGKFIRARK